MASNGVQKPRPENGMTLLVIHDFTARGTDELSLTRGDKVELIERDDDFGDGWYLGRHLGTGMTGLFPEVYTKIAPPTPPVAMQPEIQRSPPAASPSPQQPFLQPQIQQQQQQPVRSVLEQPISPQASQLPQLFQNTSPALPLFQQQPQAPVPPQPTQQQSQPQSPQVEQKPQQSLSQKPDVSPTSHAQLSPVDRPETPILNDDVRFSAPAPQSPEVVEQQDRHISSGQVLDANREVPAPVHTPPALSSSIARPTSSNGVTIPASQPIPTTASAVPKSLVATSGSLDHGADSPVMNETLSVIQEHITDMSTPRNSDHRSKERMQSAGGLTVPDDSSSEYSGHTGNGGHRMSYINGSETDEEEEEERKHQRAEVNRWTPDDVAEYLATVGVEPKHCDVFRDQEISGDVLLGMDQATIFLKEFELGSVGRRLKTWQKIKGLQDEVNDTTPHMGSQSGSRRQMSHFGGSDYGSEGRAYSGYNTPRGQSSLNDRPQSSRATGRFSQRHRPMDSIDSQSTAYGGEPQKRPSTAVQRPSAANIREMNHRQSSTGSPSLNTAQSPPPPAASAPPQPSHKKLPSFDRNWTMGPTGSVGNSRPISQVISQPIPIETQDDMTTTNVNRASPFEFDRGYFSGGEADPANPQRRNVLKKRGDSHSRNSSYTDEARQRSGTAVNRHSRFGSMDSVRGASAGSYVSPAAAKYHGLVGSRRTPDLGSSPPLGSVPRPAISQKEGSSPTVTRLDEQNGKTRGPASAQITQSPDWLKNGPEARQPGFRAISDAVTGGEKKMLGDSLRTADQVQSPTSSTHSGSDPSAKASIDADATSSKTSLPGQQAVNRKKTKKETSAYRSGLRKISPKEAMRDCDYSGWMKKKSTNLMATWKPRLFILKGRRLSYYYSEEDTEEKGLIDISFHRVLPADNDRLTGLHATLTGATSSPSTLATPHSLPTTAQADLALSQEKGILDPHAANDTTMFIFKLVPPRAGLNRAVMFTKPTVHYFAVENVAVARLWMAALMKATIERDDEVVKTTYQQKTISLRKAREMRQRPPALMGDDDDRSKGKGRAGEELGELGGGMGLGLDFGLGGDGSKEEREEERAGKRRSYRGVDSPIVN